jgi:ribosome biogenesis SPOUT family RNA methylase Rps3
MEEDEETTKAIPPWVELEYAVCLDSILREKHISSGLQHMRTLAGPSAQVYFTNLSQTSSDSLKKIFGEASKDDALAHASCHQIGVLDLMKQASISLEEVCLLDPKAEKELSPPDGDGRFSWFLFGVCLQLL